MGPEVDHVEQQRLRTGLARLGTGPIAPVDAVTGDVRRRVAHRRRRRAAAVTVVAVSAVAAGVWATSEPPTAEVVTANGRGAAGTTGDGRGDGALEPVSVISVGTEVQADGGQTVSVQLDGPVPDRPVTFVDDITDPDAPGIGYTTQGPSGLHVCGARHWFPGVVGTVDVLLPADWLAPGSPDADMGLTTSDVPGAPGKVVACGPWRGYVQYSIWGAVSDDQADVEVRVEPDGDGSVVVVDIRRQGPDQAASRG